MTLFRPKTIRLRLFRILIVAITAIVAIAVVIWLWIIKPALKQGVVKQQQEVARRIADQIDEFLKHRISELSAAAEIGRFWEMKKDLQKEALYRLMKLDPQIHEVSVAGLDGREFLRLSKFRVYTDADLIYLGKEDKFLRALGGENHIGAVYYARTAEPFVTIAVPIRFTARGVRGVVVAEVSLKTLWDSFSYITIGKSGHAFVTDQSGNLIAHPDYSKVLLGTNVSHLDEFKEFRENPNGDQNPGAMWKGESGRTVLTTFAAVKKSGWAVVVEEPVESALSEVRQIEQIGMLFLLVLLLGSSGISYFFSTRITRPVRQLEEGARRIARGDLLQKLEIRTGDEIENLANEFNDMAGQVRIHREELEQRVAEKTRDLSALYALTGPLGRTRALKEMLNEATCKIMQVTGADAAYIRLLDETGQRFVLTSSQGLSEACRHQMPLEVREGPMAEQALRTGIPLISEDLSTDLTPMQGLLARSGYRSATFIPLQASGSAFGILTLASWERGKINARQKESLSAMAQQISIAIENARLFEEIQLKAEELSVLHTAASTFNQALDLKTTLQVVLDAVLKVISADAASIRLRDFQSQEMTFVVNREFPSVYLNQRSRFGDIGLAGREVLSTGEAFLSADMKQDPLFRGGILQSFGYRSAVYVPIKSKEKTFGILNLVSREPGHFDLRDKELLLSVSHQLGAALENAWLFGETQRNLKQLKALREIDVAITSTLDVRAVLDVLLEKIDLFLPYAAATIRLFNKERDFLEPVACRNIDEKEWKAEKWMGGRGLVNIVFETRAPVIMRQVQSDPRVRDVHFYLKNRLVSYLGVPLLVKDQILGVLSFYTKEEHEFTSDEIEFLTALAGQAAIAIHNSQLYEEIKKQAAHLEKSNRVKSDFLSVMSHELRTPLNLIMGYAEMMRERLLGEITEEQRQGLEKITRCSDELLAMIMSILEATRIEADDFDIELREVQPGDLLDQLRSAYQIPLQDGLTLAWDYPPDLPVIRTDREKLKHILENLINNAIKFTAEGQVQISARYLPQEKRVKVTVADTGIGISHESLTAIFEKFCQVDSSETRIYGGVGLGLYIVKKYTDRLGGQVEVESQPGKGSIFTVTLPVEGGHRTVDRPEEVAVG